MSEIVERPFKGDLVECARALLSLDADGALVPHGIGGHARSIIGASIFEITRLSAELDKARAESARLRDALENNGSMDFFRDGAKHMRDAIQSQTIHVQWGPQAVPDDGITLALDLTKSLADETLARLAVPLAPEVQK